MKNKKELYLCTRLRATHIILLTVQTRRPVSIEISRLFSWQVSLLQNGGPSAKMWESPKTCKHQTNHTTGLNFVHTIRSQVFHNSVHENYGLLGYDIMWFGKEVPALWRKLLPPLQGPACTLTMEAADYSINIDTKQLGIMLQSTTFSV